jgi:hypothetical protein
MACFAVLFKLEMGGISVMPIAPLGFFQLEGDQAPYARHRLSGDYHHAFFSPAQVCPVLQTRAHIF